MSFVSEETKQLVKDIISIPSISSACFDEHSITVQFSQKDFDNDCARKYVRNYVETSSGYKSCGIPMELVCLFICFCLRIERWSVELDTFAKWEIICAYS